MPNFIDAPFVEGSAHAFADKFFALSAGCYDVQAAPYGEGAKACSVAELKQVLVEAGKTTERLLVSQCLGVDKGALDTIAALNHDPVIDDLYFPTSKFSCAEPTVICVEASDPDGDPPRDEITLGVDDPCVAGPFEASTNPETGTATQCAALSCSGVGSYKPVVTVYDQAKDASGALVDIETLLADLGTSGKWNSRASIEAQIHVDGYMGYIDADGDGFGDEAYFGCDDPGTLVTANDNCDDTDPAINPDAEEICNDGIDNGCDGEVGELPQRRFAVGDLIASFDAVATAGIPTCPVGTGIACDGTNLILSCWSTNILERVDAVAHTNAGSVAVTGLPNGNDLRAMAWDAGRSRLWACNGSNLVVLIRHDHGKPRPIRDALHGAQRMY